MTKARVLFSIVLVVTSTTIGYSQSKLTQKQIKNRNYQEVIGGKYDSADTLANPDTYAMYPEGMKGIRKHISERLIYPRNAYKNNIQGSVVVRFVVEKNGEIGEIEVVRSVDPELDAEAIRVIKKLKVWVPAYKDGKPVRVEYLFPFNFQF